MTEAPGLAPEEVEALITFPLESAINGATGVQAVRSQSGIGLSVMHVEFDWGTDLYQRRQVVAERLALATEGLPEKVSPQLAPISSIMGQIIVIGMWSEGQKTSPMQLRTLADWVVRQRLLTINGVSQVFVMGGERMQYQVLVNPHELLRYGVSVREVETALAESNENATGGYLQEQGPNEYLVRSLGRIRTVDDLKNVIVATRDGRPVLIGQVARVIEGAQVKRGDSTAFVRAESRERERRAGSGGASMERIQQCGRVWLLALRSPPSLLRRSGGVADDQQAAECGYAASDRAGDDGLARAVEQSAGGRAAAPRNVPAAEFIDPRCTMSSRRIRDGSILVVIILFVVLLNFRTTFITLTAIPLSIVVTAIVFGAFGLSINTMTLGGLAVAIGEFVDDAVVDVENIFRRLKENRHAANPRAAILVVFQASTEIRNSIVFSTITVVLAFTPVFALGGMEGRLFAPVGVAYIVSIVASLLVSLTLTPVLAYWLLGRSGIWPWVAAVLRPSRRWACRIGSSPPGCRGQGCRTQADGGRVCRSRCTCLWLA